MEKIKPSKKVKEQKREGQKKKKIHLLLNKYKGSSFSLNLLVFSIDRYNPLNKCFKNCIIQLEFQELKHCIFNYL